MTERADAEARVPSAGEGRTAGENVASHPDLDRPLVSVAEKWAAMTSEDRLRFLWSFEGLDPAALPGALADLPPSEDEEAMMARYGSRPGLTELAERALADRNRRDAQTTAERLVSMLEQEALIEWSGFTDAEVAEEADRLRLAHAEEEGTARLLESFVDPTSSEARAASFESRMVARLLGGEKSLERIMRGGVSLAVERGVPTPVGRARLAQVREENARIAEMVDEARERVRAGQRERTATDDRALAILVNHVRQQVGVRAGRARARQSAGGPRRSKTKTSSGSGGDSDPGGDPPLRARPQRRGDEQDRGELLRVGGMVVAR